MYLYVLAMPACYIYPCTGRQYIFGKEIQILLVVPKAAHACLGQEKLCLGCCFGVKLCRLNKPWVEL